MGFKIGKRAISENSPAYFIADIASNHDGDLNRAKKLISLARESGADGVKFQHFLADKIVSKYGFEKLGGQFSHQKKWPKPVYEIYKDASIPRKWTGELKKHCDKESIDFLSSPYDMKAVDLLNDYVSVYKIGSGDITWPDILVKLAKTGKPLILATGASTLEDVDRAVNIIIPINKQLSLLQCNTNYTGSKENFKYVSLNVIKLYRELYPALIIGLSDHTPFHAAVLGAVTLGARIIEKHFTDDNNRSGPDHPFSMNPVTWKEMVLRTRELELSLGDKRKIVEDNENQTVILQRRCVRAAVSLKAGDRITRNKLSVLRPAPPEAVMPYDIEKVVGKQLKKNVDRGDAITWGIFK